MADGSSIRERRNWLIHLLYVRQDYDECLNLIEEQLRECQGLCEYAIYIKGLIKRCHGELQESLTLFEAATMLNPHNVANLKQVGKGLYLLGKHKAAVEIYEEAKTYSDKDDWEICQNTGVCHMYLKNFEKAEQNFVKANVIQRHDSTYLQLGKLYTMQEKYEQAIEVYLEALEHSPENPELLTAVGLLYLRVSENFKAFDYLGNSLTHDPRNPKTILAAGSIIQDHNDMDVALSKYRVAAVQTPNSAQLWNNIGMCFFGKQNYIASISCLRRALYLSPFEWIIPYNLGIVFLHTRQYASSFHYLSTSINLKPDFASSYMYLGVCLNHLDDFDNSCSAYEKAISMEMDHLFELNFTISLILNEEWDVAKQHFLEYERLFEELDEETKKTDGADLQETAKKVAKLLKNAPTSS